ncbi:MAG: hypothetical protein IJ555_07305 [Ruminococcus sp.]|nr:hypothetical protein [Ruminococcus sp.]
MCFDAISRLTEIAAVFAKADRVSRLGKKEWLEKQNFSNSADDAYTG